MEYSPLFNDACIAIGACGIGILNAPKYKSQIKKTLVKTLSNGLVSVTYINSREEIVAETFGGFREWYPMIGEIEEVKQ